MEEKNISEELADLIKRMKHPSHLTTNKKEISIRCPYCGDSRKKASSTHLYIQLSPPFKFFCHKCNTGGVLKPSTMRDLGIYDPEESIKIVNISREQKNKLPVSQVSKFKVSKLPLDETETSKLAVDYFNQRFNTNYDNKYIVSKFKAITDAKLFFKRNNITPCGFYNFNKAIGFMSSDGTHVIFRDISGMQKTRYFNLCLNQNDNEISNKIYNIKSSINIMTEKINLIITEGIFDIIGVYEHFYKGTEKEKDSIFAACCGKGYSAVILSYIKRGFLDLNIEIYSDADVDISMFKELKENLVFLKNSSIKVYYNKLEKDFGIPKDRIQLQLAIV